MGIAPTIIILNLINNSKSSLTSIVYENYYNCIDGLKAMIIKSIIFLCFGIVISGSLHAQKVLFSDLAIFEMPAGSKKLTAAEKNEYATLKNIKSKKFPDAPERTSYILDHTIFSVSVSKQNKKVLLSDIEKMQSVAGEQSGFIVKKFIVNGNSFIRSIDIYDNNIWIYGTDQSGLVLLIGLLEFSDVNKTNADLIVDKVLNAISYN